MKKLDENYFQTDSMNQNSIEDFINKDEQILWRGKPKKSAFILSSILQMLPIALIWLLFDGGFIACLCIFSDEMPIYAIIILCVFFLLHLTPVWIWISNIVTANAKHKNIEYAFTNERIIIRSGILGIDIINIYYNEINSVNLKVGLIDKWLRVGDIYITSNSHAQVLYDITNPYVITNKLQKIVNDIKTDMQYPNELRPDVNKGFKTKYNGDIKENN